MTTTKPTKVTAREVWATVYTTLMGADIVPLSVRLHPSDIDVEIQLRADSPSTVDRALSLLGLPEALVWSDGDGDAIRWFEGTPGEFIAYGSRSSDMEISPVVPGWIVSVHCNIHTNCDAVRP